MMGMRKQTQKASLEVEMTLMLVILAKTTEKLTKGIIEWWIVHSLTGAAACA
jgi:hypothetical protein